MSKRLAVFVTAVGASAICSSAAAQDDPLGGNAVLAQGEKTLINQGSSLLTDSAKRVLGAALNSYVPGLGSVLGLSAGENDSQKILDAIVEDGGKTRGLILQFWDWVRNERDASVSQSYADVESAIHDWLLFDPRVRLSSNMRVQLDTIVSDCKKVLTQMQYAPSALKRTDYLHRYVTLMSLTIALQAERAEVDVLGAEYDFSGVDDPEVWWEDLASDEKDAILDQIKTTKQGLVEGLLKPGLQISFLTQMQAMDAGTLVGGTPGKTDYETARDWQFSGTTGGYPPDGHSDGSVRWFYYFGHNDLQPNCANKDLYCHVYHIVRGGCNATTGKCLYTVDFTGGSGPYYSSDIAPYNEHRKLMLDDMVIRGYGAARAFSEGWWDVWGLGNRPRQVWDDFIDAYLDNADTGLEGVMELLADYQTLNITSAQRSRLHGFALAQGLDAVMTISSVSSFYRDYMDPATVSKRPWSVHRQAINAYPAAPEELGRQFYAGIPVSKLVAIWSGT